MKIGIFSGTFDPVHNGHIEFAHQALNTGLDQVVFMPEPEPRRKTNVLPLEHRTKMLELATQNESKMTTFVPEDHINHTPKETMILLHDKFGLEANFVLLMGGDVFKHVPNWEGSKEDLEKIQFIIGLRTEDDGETAIRIKQEHNLDAILIPSNMPRISSSKIRENASFGNRDVALADLVLQYINDRQLY